MIGAFKTFPSRSHRDTTTYGDSHFPFTTWPWTLGDGARLSIEACILPGTLSVADRCGLGNAAVHRALISELERLRFWQRASALLRWSLFKAPPTEKQLVHLVEDKTRRRTTARLTQIVWRLYVHVSRVVGKKARPKLASLTA